MTVNHIIGEWEWANLVVQLACFFHIHKTGSVHNVIQGHHCYVHAQYCDKMKGTEVQNAGRFAYVHVEYM